MTPSQQAGPLLLEALELLMAEIAAQRLVRPVDFDGQPVYSKDMLKTLRAINKANKALDAAKK